MTGLSAQAPELVDIGREVRPLLLHAYRTARRNHAPAVSEGFLLWPLVAQFGFGVGGELLPYALRLRRGLRHYDAVGPSLDLDLGEARSVSSSNVIVTLRESHWRGCSETGVDLPWTHGVLQVLETAVTHAAATHQMWVSPLHLADALLDTPSGDITHLLRGAGMSAHQVRAGVAKTWPADRPDSPYRPTRDGLELIGALSGVAELPWKGGYATAYRVLNLAFFRIRPLPVIEHLELEANRLAVRWGHARVTTAHLFLAVLSLNLQLLGDPDPLDANHVMVNRALASSGITLQDALPLIPVEMESGEPAPRPRWQQAGPECSKEARLAVSAATVQARRRPLFEHGQCLLASSLSAPEGAAAELVRRLELDPASLVRGWSRA